MKTREIIEYGDFQTPIELGRAVCKLLAEQGVRPASLFEPTCGRGNLLFAGLDQFPDVTSAFGMDINVRHIAQAAEALGQRKDNQKVRLIEGDFFQADLANIFSTLPQPLLVLGNPPWVTNTHLGTFGGRNLPVKSNFQNRTGCDAITGKANFDISESMLLRIVEQLDRSGGSLAMLCKTTVARKILAHCWGLDLGVKNAAMYRIDADYHFNAAVQASLLVIQFGSQSTNNTATVYPGLTAHEATSTVAYRDGTLIANLDMHRRWCHLTGDESISWRSGIKHDCSRIMELRRDGDQYRNGLAELVSLEDTYLFPMLKSSEISGGSAKFSGRWMLVPQRRVGDDTSIIKDYAPLTWNYLQAHADLFKQRKSSIYLGKPKFSIFGVGDYSFSPWKVAISGFYKKLNFVSIGSADGKPFVLDDTCYFLPCPTQHAADYLVDLLNSDIAREFFNSYVFWDSKRPITVDLLGRLNLRLLANELGTQTTYDSLFGESTRRKKNAARKQKATTAGKLALWSA